MAAAALQAAGPSPEPSAAPPVISREWSPTVPSDPRGFRIDPSDCIPARGSKHPSDVIDYCKFPGHIKVLSQVVCNDLTVDMLEQIPML